MGTAGNTEDIVVAIEGVTGVARLSKDHHADVDLLGQDFASRARLGVFISFATMAAEFRF